MNKIDIIIENVIKNYINEGRYDDSDDPYNSHTQRRISLGYNPLTTDIGGHSTNDVLSQVSTIDYNGANFVPSDKLLVSDNKFIFYKVKHFGNDKIDGTLDLFGKGAKGEVELRKAIDTLNGAAVRNNKPLLYRVVTTETNKERAERSNFTKGAFWEFSLDSGRNWYILKPSPVQKMVKSTLIVK